jgi:enoyl-CoA hydratase
MAEETPVLLGREEDGHIALVTLNRPSVMNAMNIAMAARLVEVLDAVSDDPRVRAVVLTGAGERAFSSGGDLRERQGMSREQWTRQHRLFERALRRLRDLRQPVIAAVNGVAAGGGCEMALSADIIIASENARFGLPEVTRGIIPGCGGTQLMPRRLPRGMALQLLMTGELIGAADAARWGLVNAVHPAAELVAAAMRLAATIAANSPTAVQQVKRSVRLGTGRSIEQAIEIELECYQRMVDHPDRHEGVSAFNERRRPVFQDAGQERR